MKLVVLLYCGAVLLAWLLGARMQALWGFFESAEVWALILQVLGMISVTALLADRLLAEGKRDDANPDCS